MREIKSQCFSLRTENDIVSARQAARKWALELSFSLVDQTKIVTAVSELTRNALIYGKGGEMTLIALENNQRKGLRVIVEDQGPGIPDLDLALQNGFTTGTGLGLGLGGSKRLSHEFDIESKVGQGTRVTIARWV